VYAKYGIKKRCGPALPDQKLVLSGFSLEFVESPMKEGHREEGVVVVLVDQLGGPAPFIV
jgi:hypothetical protein